MGMVGLPDLSSRSCFAAHVEEREIGERKAVQVLDRGGRGITADGPVFPPDKARHLRKARIAVQRFYQHGESGLPLAGDAVVGVLEGLLRQEADVGAAEHHGNAPLPERVGDRIGARARLP